MGRWRSTLISAAKEFVLSPSEARRQKKGPKLCKLWVFSPFFYPEVISTGKYNSILVRSLAGRGASIEVVTSHPFYPAWRPVRCYGEFENFSVHRGGAWVRYPRSILLRRLILELWFSFHATYRAWVGREDLRTVVGVFPPSLFFVFMRFLLPPSAKKIGIVHDLQGILGLSGSGFGKRLLYRMVRAVEKKAFRSCDKLIFLSHSMAKTAAEEYGLDADKVIVRYPFATVSGSGRAGCNLAGLFPEDARHVVYSGALGKKQNSFLLYEFFRDCAPELPDVHFHLFSGGPMFEELKNAHNADPMERIHFHNLVNEVDLEELYARSTLQLIPQSEVSSNACLPSKLPNILATGCAVLAICERESELAQILQQTGTGIVAYSWEPSVLLGKLKEALNMAKLRSREQRRADVKNLLLNAFSLDALVGAVLCEKEDGTKLAPMAVGTD
jgi:colanic acid biosynthesis glycosyl transferase WcaI